GRLDLHVRAAVEEYRAREELQVVADRPRVDGGRRCLVERRHQLAVLRAIEAAESSLYARAAAAGVAVHGGDGITGVDVDERAGVAVGAEAAGSGTVDAAEAVGRGIRALRIAQRLLLEVLEEQQQVAAVLAFHARGELVALVAAAAIRGDACLRRELRLGF